MCDYSLEAFKSRPAVTGDKLLVRRFGTGTTGLCAVDDHHCVVCLLPGTELAFEQPIDADEHGLLGTIRSKIAFLAVLRKCEHTTAIFRQMHNDEPHRHHDALELPDGTTVLVNALVPGQKATVLQLPVQLPVDRGVEVKDAIAKADIAAGDFVTLT